MENEIQDLIAKFKAKGYSDEQIKAFLVQRKGFDTNDVEAEFGSEKKNFDSQSASQSDLEASQGSPSDTDTSPQAEQSASDSSTDNYVVRANRTRELAGKLGEMQQQESLYEQFYGEEKEGTIELYDVFQTAGFAQAGGVDQGKEEEFQKEMDIRFQESEMRDNGASAEEIFNFGQTARGNYEEIENLYREILPDAEYEFFYEDEETGLKKVNEYSAAQFGTQLEQVEQDDMKRLNTEMAKLEEKNEIQEIGYDVWTGIRGMGFGLQGLWNPEQAQYNLYADQSRTQASYKVEGLTDEEIEKGLFGNLKDGNMNAFTTMFGTQLAQTAPQLAVQAGLTYASGGLASGLGLSAKAASSAGMWTSSAFMGAQTFGATSAQYYGLVDDNKRFTMALGDALVETLSERAFPDDMFVLTKAKYKGASLNDIRRDFFGVGIMSKEFRQMGFKMAQRQGRQFVESGLEEGMEEMLAGIGSQYIHAHVNDEEFNLVEAIDGMIVGFGAGAKSRAFRSVGESITATASSLGFGGIRGDMVKIRQAKQKLKSELVNTTDATRKSQIESKIEELSKIELGHKKDMDSVYSDYSDEDAKSTISLNQSFHAVTKKLSDPKISEEEKSQLKSEAVEILNSIQEIEAKYGDNIARVQQQREAVRNINYDESGKIVISEESDNQGVDIIENMKNVSKATGKEIKGYNSYKAMADEIGTEVENVRGSSGIYVDNDGSIHILMPAAANNTVFHEAFHDVASSLDANYVKRFVEGAMAGMSKELRAKYTDFGSQYETDSDVYYEEIFAELSADIASGALSVDGVGSSVASLAMSPLIKVLKKAGLFKGRSTASFTQFADYVNSVGQAMKYGRKAEVMPESIRTKRKNRVEFMKQLSRSENMEELASPSEILSEGFMPYNSTITHKINLNSKGNFTFYHRSPAKFDVIDPSKFGQNIKTSKEERLQVGLAGVSVAMFATSPAGIDVGGEFLYKLELNPNEVYNAVDDPEGIVADAKAALKAEGKAASGNTLYAKATKMASERGYKATVTPWTSGSVKIQTVEQLPVTEVQEKDESVMKGILLKYALNGYEVVSAEDVRTSMNKQAGSLISRTVREVVGEQKFEMIRKLSYAAMDGRFGNPATIEEYQDKLQSALESVDTSHPDADFVSAQLTNAIKEANSFGNKKGYSRRAPNEDALTKTLENAWNEISKGEGSFGFTIDPVTGEFMTEGTIVGDQRSEEKFGMVDVAAAQMKKADILKKIETAWNIALQNPKGTVGGWWNSASQNENGDNFYYLDSGEVYAEQETAERLGRERKELGVFNIKSGEYIPISSLYEHDSRDSKEKGLRAQKIGKSEVEQMTEMMNAMPIEQLQWTEPVESSSLNINAVELNGQEIPAEVLEALGVKNASELVRPTADFNGIPTLPAMSDALGSGNMKDANGNPMRVNGGIGTGIWGSGFADGLAWCGVTRHEAEIQMKDAINVYNGNKALFERLWKEEKLPNGHVPMVIMRMADTAINSNEAVLRYIYPYIQNFPKANRKAAGKALVDRIQSDYDWLQEKKERHEKGLTHMDKATRSVKDPSKKQVGLTTLEKNQIKSQERLLNFVKNNKVETLDDILSAIADDSTKRARAAITKAHADSFLQLTDKEYITSILFRPHADSIDGYKQKTKANEIVATLFGELEGDAEKFTFHNVMESIAEPAMRQIPANHAVAVMGVDVLSPAVLGSTHENYGFGPKGRFIAFLKDPQHGISIFPEWRAKSARMAVRGTKDKKSVVLQQIGSTFFGDKAFRGMTFTQSPNDVKQVLAKMRHAFPFVQIGQEKSEFKKMVEQEGFKARFSSTGNMIYGISKDNRVILNPAAETTESAIHEFGHVWLKFLSEGAGSKGRKILQKGLELAKESELYQEQLDRYGDPELAAEETLAEAIAQRGENIRQAAIKSKFQSWMKGMFEFIKRSYKTIFAKGVNTMTNQEAKDFIENMTLEDFVNLSLAELFQGKQVKSSYRPSLDGESKARARVALRKQKISDTSLEWVSKNMGMTSYLQARTITDADAIKDIEQLLSIETFEDSIGAVDVTEDVDAGVDEAIGAVDTKKAIKALLQKHAQEGDWRMYESLGLFIVESPDGRTWDFGSEMSALDFLDEVAPLVGAVTSDDSNTAGDILRSHHALTEEERLAFERGRWLSDASVSRMAERSADALGIKEPREELVRNRAIVERFVKTDGVSLKRYAETLLDEMEIMHQGDSLPTQGIVLKEMLRLGMMDKTFLIVDRNGSYHEAIEVEEAGGVFDTTRDDVVAINGMYDSTLEDIAHIIVHEQLHRLTALANRPNTKFSNALGVLMDEVFEQAKKSPEEMGGWNPAAAITNMYGMSNSDELIAEAFTNPEFQKLIQQIKVSKNAESAINKMGYDIRTKSIFEAFVDLVLAAMGKFNINIISQNAETNLLDAVVSLVDQEVSRRTDPFITPPSIRQQAGVYRMVADAIKRGLSKKQIIQDLKEAGFTQKDADLLYAKAAGYNTGKNAGIRAGSKARSKEYAERRKKELREEREEAKALRKRAKELFNREKRVTDAMVEEIFNYVKGLKGVNIKLSQMKTIIRLMKSANRKVYGNGAKTHRNYAVFLSFVDAVAKIIDKQVDAKQMEDHAKLLRSVNATQKKLALRVKKMNKVSRSPLASYIEQVENLTSIDAGLLTFKTLQSLSSSLNSLQNTTKTVGARIQGEEASLTKPYVYIEETDSYVDTRTAKVYFDEMYASIKNEADQRQEAILIEQAMNIAFEDGTDWYTAYQELLRKKDLTVIQKKLEAIAEEMDLDMDNVQDLEAVLELYEEQQKENKSKIRKAIIQDAVLPTFQNWKTLLLTNEDFAKIFGYDSEISEEAAMELVEQRVNRLTLTELKKLEFFMFDFIANGKTYGLQALSAAAEAKNEGNNRLRKLNMEASTTAGVAKNLRNGYFNLFENTPTFFRRIFKRYSQAKVAQYMNAIGFGGLRNSAAQAEARSATFVQAVQNMLKNKNLNNIKSQTEMLVYSVLSQKPEGVSAAAWVVNLKASLKLSLENDTRLTDEQKKEVQTVLDMLESAGSMESVMSKLEANEDLMFGIDFLRKAFKTQEAGIKDYAESFLGMQFRSEDNYLPMNFRAVGSNAENLQELADRVENVGKAFKSHARTKAQAVAGAVYERNENALRSDKRYIDINFFASIERTYKENEIKVATARDVAYVSAMTSESNKDFANSVPDAGTRAQIRKKIYNYLVNASDYQQADEVLGKHGRSFVNYATNLTVVAYFGATIEQIVKQSSALMNAMIEARSMAARIHYVNTIVESITPEFARGEEGFKVTNAKRKLMSKFGISNRDVVSETLSVVGGKKIGEKTRFEKGVELSTAALRGTDKMAATATWIAYYVDYLVSEEGVNPDDINWETEAEKPNNDAAQFADQMTIKDQNINSRRDKSRINDMTRGQALNIVKMIAMPFANFLLNKKINLSLDFQKVTMGDKKNRLEGLRSIAGTVAEVSAFQGATWMVLAPLYSVIGSALFGGDDEEESWWDKNFGKKMFKRGFFLDMNPLVVPIAAVENYMVRGINMAEYMLTEDPDDFNFADEEWSVGFERWEKLNGLPIFSSAGRGDLNVGGALGMLGVTGSVLNEIRLSMKNMVTLGQNEPFYTNRNGKERFVSREDAEQMQLIETMRTVMNAVMMVTGLQSKELAKITKSAKRPIEKRSTTDKESWIAKEIMNDASVGIDDMLGYLTTEIEGDPMNAGRKIDQIIKKAKGSMVDDFVSGANINTLRLIDKSEASNRGRAVLIHQIAETMTEAEAKQFYLDSYMYFGIKYGVETVKAQIFSDIMKYE